jgi:hypothetical protein
MGEVFEARHIVTGRRVAVKVLFETRADGAAQASGRFLREARAAGNLDADNLVQVFDAGTDRVSRRNYLVMEFLHGENLLDLVKRVGPIPPRLAMCIAGQAAIGLAKAHYHGVIHRDIKPANIFLAMDGNMVTVKVLDFGIAKIAAMGESGSHLAARVVLPEPATALTQVGAIVGSPHYMSPEQAQGLGTLDHRSDLYSLGAVLYRLLSGQTPHAGIDTMLRLLAVICADPARPIREVAPWVPEPVSQILHRAIAISPDQRYGSAEEMVHDIVSLVEDLSITPEEIGALEPGVSPATFPTSLSPPARMAPPPRGPAVRAADVVAGPPRGSAGSSLVVAISIGVLLVVGVGFWRVRSLAAAARARDDSAHAAAPDASEPARRTVWVRIHPPDIPEIMVDGNRAGLTQAGYVEVNGEVDSRHLVVLKRGEQSHLTEIIVGAQGAVPDLVVMPAPPVAAPPASAPSSTAAKGKHSSAKHGHHSLEAPPLPTFAPQRPPRREDDDDPAPIGLPPISGNPFAD